MKILCKMHTTWTYPSRFHKSYHQWCETWKKEEIMIHHTNSNGTKEKTPLFAITCESYTYVYYLLDHYIQINLVPGQIA